MEGLRIRTVPNLISFVRLCCIPWFLYLVFGSENLVGAAYLLAVLGATDWVDGYVARHFNQISTFGKVLDPSVDRLMLAVAAVTIVSVGAMPLWFGLLALGREVVVMVGGAILWLAGARRIDVQFVGKAGAMGLMLSLPLFLISAGDVSWDGLARVLAWLFGIPGLVLGWYSLIGYFGLAREAIRAGRSGRSADRVGP